MDPRSTWRTVGYWGITFNVVLGFWVIVVVIILRPEADTTALISAYAALCTLWGAAAGIRQWGKNNNPGE